MRLGQLRIDLNGAESSALGLFPGACRRRLDVPIQQRITIGEFRVSERKPRIDLHGATQTFNRLSHSFGGAASRVIASGGVKLTRFFVATVERLRRRTRHRRSY